VSGFLTAIVGGIYVWVAIDQALLKNFSMAVTFGAYALANAGLFFNLK